MRLTFLIFVATIAGSPIRPQERPASLQSFVMVYSPGENSAETRWTQEHFQHIRKMFAGGKMIAVGPFKDGKGAMAILSVGDENEAREIVNADPNIRAKVNVAELYAWEPLFTPGPRTVTAGKGFFAVLYARASTSGPA